MVTNGDFESGSTFWTLEGAAAVRDDLVPHGGLASLFLFASYSSFGPVSVSSSAKHYSVPARVGEDKRLYFWVNPDGGGTRPVLRIAVDVYGTSNFSLIVFSKKKADLPPGWSFQQTDIFVPAATDISFQVHTPQNWGPINGSGFFLVDDINDEIVPETEELVRKRDAYTGLTTRLTAINGSPTYRTDLGGRVYPVLATPDKSPDLLSPYVCLVQEESGTYGDGSTTAYERIWRMLIFGFVREKASNRLQSTIANELADLEDDIVDTIMSDERLGGAVTLCRLVAQEAHSGTLPDDYGELMLTVELTQWVAPEVLGP